MSSYNQEEKPWKKKLKKTFLTMVIIAVVIGLLVLASSANNKAKANMAELNVPEYNVWFLPGGPERFSEHFEDAMSENDDKKVKQDSFIWNSILVKNEGLSEANSVSIQIDAALPLSQVFVETMGYGNEASITLNEEDNTKARIEVDSIDTDETAYVFIGFNPETIQQFKGQYQKESWVDHYKSALNLIYVESANAETTYYGYAAANFAPPKG